MLDQDIPNFERLPSKGKTAPIAKDSDIVLLRYVEASWILYILTCSNTLSMELKFRREGWKFFQTVVPTTRYSHVSLCIDLMDPKKSFHKNIVREESKKGRL